MEIAVFLITCSTVQIKTIQKSMRTFIDSYKIPQRSLQLTQVNMLVGCLQGFKHKQYQKLAWKSLTFVAILFKIFSLSYASVLKTVPGKWQMRH
jgi:hypothetical protein